VQCVGLELVLVRRVNRGGGQGADGLAGSIARVGGVLRHCDVLAAGRYETPHSGFGPRLNRRSGRSQDGGQSLVSAELAGHVGGMALQAN